MSYRVPEERDLGGQMSLGHYQFIEPRREAAICRKCQQPFERTSKLRDLCDPCRDAHKEKQRLKQNARRKQRRLLTGI